MTGPLLASRVRKARAQSVCGMCTAIIRIGNSIGRVPGAGWCHAACIVQANRNVRPAVPGGTREGTTMINDCPLCELYTDGEAHQEHAAWRDLATPDEVTAIHAALADHSAAEQALTAARSGHDDSHKRAQAVIVPVHRRCLDIERDKRLAGRRDKLAELIGGDPAALTADQAQRLVGTAQDRADAAFKELEILRQYAWSAGLIEPEEPPF